MNPPRRIFRRFIKPKLNNINSYVIGTIAMFAVMGFYGSLVLFMAWPIALFVGWVCYDSWYRTKLSLVAAMGIFLGGLPMWILFCTMVNINHWPLRLLLIASTPLFFLSGVVAHDLTDWILRFKRSHSGDNAPTVY